MKNSEKRDKKRFNLYDFLYKRENNADVYGDQDAPRNFTFFFKLMSRNLRNFFSLNLYFIIGNFPILIILFAISGNLNHHTIAPQSEFFGPIYGALQNGVVSPKTSSIFGSYGVFENVSRWTTPAYIVLAVGIVLLLITFGPVCLGTSYNTRNIIKGEPLFMWSDFWFTIKKNLRQAITLGAIDLIIIALLGYNIFFYYLNLGSSIQNIFFYLTIAIMIIYFFMRYYMYIMLATFNLSIVKIFKNALIFSVLGFGRNILAFIGIAFVVIFNYLLMMVYFPVGIVLLLVITIGLCLFISAYAAWPKIEQVMITPYIDENK